ncbi:glycosyltransferase family 2 protein [Phaeodactylibacter xiamenensis]|uniref:glycosyltransferase family 2 protein n=1 Tax=Phaeodactylibacter xiamenensis TaxID=1524460 RepID=UPI0024A7BFA2|nr:glycosyltransferase family 2 protein [Phaeodactylibacter xiamenensis]
MSVTVVIPLYNGSALIERCLDSVFEQQVANLEVIVVDDGSTDDSVAIVKNYPKPIILLQQQNQGPAAARNKGIEHATGKYIAFLDADDYWLPGFIDRTCRFLEAHRDVIAVSVGQRHILPGKKEKIIPDYLVSPNGEEPVTPFVIPDFFDYWNRYNHVCTGSVMMRTATVKTTDGQRTDLRITEDLEFWALLATYGQWGIIPEVLFISDGSKVTQQQGWWEKNYKRWASAPSVEEWEKRIKPRLDRDHLMGYKKARGRIAKNLAYSALLSGRTKLSKDTVIQYSSDFPPDKLSKILQLASKNDFTWKVVTKLLVSRERKRKA